MSTKVHEYLSVYMHFLMNSRTYEHMYFKQNNEIPTKEDRF
jgi:hypothetical protein